MEKDFDYYKKLINKNQLPNDFDQWLMTDKDDGYGTTLAHFAAYNCKLPRDWTDKSEDWLIKDKLGNTVAHHAAYSGSLPDDFTELSIKNNDGKTIGYYHYLFGDFSFSDSLKELCDDVVNHIVSMHDNNNRDSLNMTAIEKIIFKFQAHISNATTETLMKTSDDYSGFLIDYVENTVSAIFEKIKNFQEDKAIIKNTEDLLLHISQHRTDIKEQLFKKTTQDDKIIFKFDEDHTL